ncbi:hypothetical protein GF373_04390, partial [bacterium]|nr:hypothetical protein [bacterium]
MKNLKGHFTYLMENSIGALRIILALATPFCRPWRTRWGTPRTEQTDSFPGDEFNPHPQWCYTHAITIHAAPREVWPWIAQLGQDRGGFYSYEGLENLFKCHIRNADCIVAEYQTRAVGDEVRLHPNMPGLPI